MNIFVKRNDTIPVAVFAWQDEDNIDATHVEAEIPKGKEYETINCTLRRNSYADSTGILRQAIAAGKEDNIDVSVFQDLILRTLLTGWDIKDVPVNTGTINELQPAIARAIVAGYLAKVRI